MSHCIQRLQRADAVQFNKMGDHDEVFVSDNDPKMGGIYFMLIVDSGTVEEPYRQTEIVRPGQWLVEIETGTDRRRIAVMDDVQFKLHYEAV